MIRGVRAGGDAKQGPALPEGSLRVTVCLSSPPRHTGPERGKYEACLTSRHDINGGRVAQPKVDDVSIVC